MSPATQVLLSGLLTFGVPLLFALHELLALRRADRGGPPPPPAPPPRPPAPKPLPDCLIPRPMAPERRPRVLQDA